MWHSYIPNMRSVQASLVEISCLQGFHNLTPNDLWPPPKTIGFLYSMWHSYIPNMRSVRASLLEISCLQGFYNVFTIWPLLTSNDLWPPPKTIGFLYSMWYTYKPNMRSVRASLLEISCFQAGITTYTHTYIHTRQHEYKGYDYHRNQKFIGNGKKNIPKIVATIYMLLKYCAICFWLKEIMLSLTLRCNLLRNVSNWHRWEEKQVGRNGKLVNTSYKLT